MSGILIRNNCSIGDVSAIVQLHTAYYCREYGFNHEFEEYVRKPLSEFAVRSSERERIWIAEHENEVKGCIALVRNSADESQLRWFIIHKTLQGNGLGAQLVVDLIHFAEENEYKRIMLWTISELHAAIRIYKRNGFIMRDENRHFIWGKELKELKYQRDLGN